MSYAKHLRLTATLLLLICFSVEGRAQFSIRRNASNTAAVDILYTAPAAGQGTHPVQFFEFALQIPNAEGGSTVTASWAPAAPLAALSGFQAYTGTDYGSATFAWASTGVPNYANTYLFPATEVILGTVTFSPAANIAGATLSAIDYQNQSIYGGPGTGVAVWTMQVDAFGTEVTNYNNLFYKSAQSGSVPGSTPPFTTADGSVSNQKISLIQQSLPVKLIDFSAKAQNCTVALNWTTASERNFDHFDVTYSTDAYNFRKLGSVNSHHNAMGSTYQYATGQSEHTGYYRLTMVDADGSYEMSNVVVAYTNCKGNTGMSWNIYPNPATGINNVTADLVSGTSMKDARLIITDLFGRKLSEQRLDIEQGSNRYQIPVSDWPRGTYIVQLYDAAGTLQGTVQKLVLN